MKKNEKHVTEQIRRPKRRKKGKRRGGQVGGAGHRAADFGGDGGARPFLRKRNRAVFAEIGNLVFPSVFAQSADRQDHSAGHALRPAYLRDEKRLPDKEKRKDILKNIMAMGMHRFGSVIVNGTDNLIMSAFVGLTSVGIYSNYRLVLRNLNDLLCKVYSAFYRKRRQSGRDGRRRIRL